jgi:4,5-DOPA dioxygenase extradiol
MNTLPPLFVSHGSPMTALEPREAGAFMQRLGPALQALAGKPKAIVVASAHTLTREPALLAAPEHTAVYDFGGFDPRLHTLRYDAPGAPALAERVAQLLRAARLPAHVLAQGGLNHGIWTPLRYLFPLADIPVLPLAWPPHWSPAQLMGLGAALEPLTQEGVLIIGSGSITHNLGRVFGSGSPPAVDAAPTPESAAFREWFATQGAAAHWPALLNYRQEAPHATLMHPTDEHLLPFFVAAGAAHTGGAWAMPAQRLHSSFTFGDLGMDTFAFGPGAVALHAQLVQLSQEASVA